MNEEILRFVNAAEGKYPQELERQFPHIFSKILALWNSPDIDKYLNDLMIDTRDQRRHGFPPDVASDILSLIMTRDKVANKQGD